MPTSRWASTTSPTKTSSARLTRMAGRSPRRSPSWSEPRQRTQRRIRRSTRRPEARHGGRVADEQDWPFDQPPDAAAITVRAVLDGAPIVLVSHDADDDGWQFLDGNEVDVDRAVLISMAQAVDLDPSVLEVGDLLPG